MSAVSIMKLAGVLAFLAGHSVAVKSVTRPGPQHYQRFQTVPSPADTATKLVTNFLPIPLSHVDKRQAPRIEDIVVVLDGSWWIPSCEFEKAKKALKNMMDLAKTDTKYAAVTFGSYASVNFNFLTNPPAGNRILQIPFPGGLEKNSQAGLAEAKNLFENPLSGRRVHSTKIVLLVTDGLLEYDSLHHTIFKAQELKSIGVKIYVVAVGFYMHGIDEMVKIASYPPEDHLFRVESHSGFYDVVKLVLQKVAPDKYKIVAGQFKSPCDFNVLS